MYSCFPFKCTCCLSWSVLFVQAHMQARYVILRVLLEGAGGLVSLEQTTGSNGKPDVIVRLDRIKIETLGKKAIGDFLHKLQVNNVLSLSTTLKLKNFTNK